MATFLATDPFKRKEDEFLQAQPAFKPQLGTAMPPTVGQAAPQPLVASSPRSRLGGAAGLADLFGGQQRTTQPFNLQDTELFKASQQTALDQMAGKLPGQVEAENQARETFKAAQATKAQKLREGLIGSGFRDTGKYLEEGYLKPAAEEERARVEFERGLIADRGKAARETIAQGQQSAGNLLNLLQSGQITQQEFDQKKELLQLQLTSEENRQLEDLKNKKETLGMQLTSEEARQLQELEARKYISQQEITSKESMLDKQLSSEENRQLKDLQNKKDVLGMQLTAEEQMQLRDLEVKERIANNQIASSEKIAGMTAENQKAMIELQAKLDKDQLLTKQEFQATESLLQKQFDEAMVNKNYTNAIETLKMQQQHDKVMQAKDAEYKATAQKALFDFEYGKQATELEFKKQSEFLEKEHQLAIQKNDIDAQKFLEEKKQKLAIDMQIAQFGQENFMANVNAQIAEAKANGDVIRQKELMLAQHGLELEKMKEEQGYEKALMWEKKKIDEMLQKNEFEQAQLLQQNQFIQQTWEVQQNHEIQELEIKLKQSGVDMAKIEQEYNMIMDQVSTGNASPEMAVAFLKKKLPDGVEYKPPDPMAQKKALDEDYLVQQYQYAQTHPGAGKYDNTKQPPEFLGLNDQYIKQFNDHLNNTVYGSDATPEKAEINKVYSGETNVLEFIGGDKESENYKLLFNDPRTVVFQFDKKQVGTGANRRTVFINMPSPGGFFKWGTNLWKLTSKETENHAGVDDKKYTVQDVITGKKYTFDTQMSDTEISKILSKMGQ